MSRWEPGQSGNKNGRPPGSRNKGLTNAQLKELLSKKTSNYIKQLEDIAKDKDATLALKTKIIMGLLEHDLKVRTLVQKQEIEAKQNKAASNSPTSTEDAPETKGSGRVTSLSGYKKSK